MDDIVVSSLEHLNRVPPWPPRFVAWSKVMPMVPAVSVKLAAVIVLTSPVAMVVTVNWFDVNEVPV
jgi:hypothetical protein